MTEEEIIERVTRYKELFSDWDTSVLKHRNIREDIKFGNHLTNPGCNMVVHLILDDGKTKYPTILSGDFVNDHWTKSVVKNSLLVDEPVTEADCMVGYFIGHVV